MANTGNKIYSYLQERFVSSGLLTGNRKANNPSDPDYIAPIQDLETCPLPADRQAVTVINDYKTVDDTITITNADTVNSYTSPHTNQVYTPGIYHSYYLIDPQVNSSPQEISPEVTLHVEDPTTIGKKALFEFIDGSTHVVLDRYELLLVSTPVTLPGLDYYLNWYYDTIKPLIMRAATNRYPFPVQINILHPSSNRITFFSFTDGLSKDLEDGLPFDSGLHTDLEYSMDVGFTPVFPVVEVHMTITYPGDTYFEIKKNGGVVHTEHVTGTHSNYVFNNFPTIPVIPTDLIEIRVANSPS